MKNRKGFTLIELIAVIIILGLVLIVAIPFFTGSLKQFRTDYYENLSGNVLNAGKEFFTDNRLYLPHSYLDSAIVKMDTLEKENYIDNVKDYNGAVCDVKDSYVIAIRVSKDEVIYDSCIKCSDDEYDNTEGKTTCSSGWLESDGFTMMEFPENADPVYVYKGTSRSDLKEKLILYPKIKRCRGKAGICEEELKWVSGEGEDGVVPLYPVDMEVVNTNKVGTYVVHYKYENYANLINRDVIVYEHTGVTVSAKKYNDKYEDTIFNKVENVESDYDLSVTNRDDWAQQKIKFTFNHSFGSGVPSGLYVTHYQIFLNNRWEDYCDPAKGSNYCVKEETRQMDERVRFRIVDSLGNIGQPTEELGIRMERGVPTCTVVDSGTKGLEEWYISDVNISFTSKTDVAGSLPYSGATAPLSGILEYGITRSEKEGKNLGPHTRDGKSITWYGYVEDKANNVGRCSVTFKRDVTPPKCEVTTTGTEGTNGWYKRVSYDTAGKVTGSFEKTDDLTSGVNRYYFDENSQTTISTSTSVTNKTWTASIYDNAGNIGTCDTHFNFDNINPTCSGEILEQNTTAGVKFKVSCADTGGSGCAAGTGSTVTLTPVNTSTTYKDDVKDSAGNNSSKCGVYAWGQLQSQSLTCSSQKSCNDSACTSYSEWSEYTSGCEHTGITHGVGCGTLNWERTYSKYTCERDTFNVAEGQLCYCTCYSRSCTAHANDCSKCGCETFTASSDWTDVDSCSSSRSNCSGIDCREVYRGKLL